MMEKMRNAKKRKGFTLIELIVVIAILAILAAIAIPRFTNVRTGAEGTAKEATYRTVNSAWQVYQAEGGATNTTKTWPDDYLADTTGDATKVTVGKGTKAVVVELNGDTWGAPTTTP